MGGIHKAQPLLAASVRAGVGEEEDSAATENQGENECSLSMIAITILCHIF